MENHTIIKANGVATHVFHEGEGDPLVMLHGWAATSDSWQYAFDALKADHRVIAPDLPGHGRTGGGLLPYGIRFLRRWLTDVFDALDVPEAVLLGNSLGGAVSLAFARAFPGRVSRLVAVDALGMSDRFPFSTLGHMMRRFPNLIPLAFTRKFDPYLLRYLAGMVVLDPWAQRDIILTMTRLNLAGGIMSLWSGTRVMLEDFLMPGRRRQFAADLREIPTPTLIVWGRHDGLLPIAHAYSGLERLRDARVCVFEHSAHMPMMEEPDAFIEIVRAFLKSSKPEENPAMEETTQINRISSIDENGLRTFITQQATEADLMDYWGEDARDIRAMALEREQERKQGDSLIIMLPGLMGSTLLDAGDFRQLLWVNPLAYARGHLNRLDLNSSGKKAVQSGVNVQARDLLWVIYAKMLLQLRRNYEVTTFAYDWRMATWDTAPLLKDFIDQALAASHFKKVTLVGHSLGGLLAMDYLIGEQTRAHAEKAVQRVITLGSPFKGALLPVTYLARGAEDDVKLKLIEGMNAENKPLQMLRTFPSMYQILPAPNDLYPGWNPVPDEDIWQAETWSQQGVPISLDHLKQAFGHHQQLAGADPQVPVFSVVGALYTTPVGLDGDLLRGMLKRVVEGPGSGDGTVAIASAIFRDRPAYYVHEVHSELVIEKTVIEGIGAWVEGGEPTTLVRRVEDVVRRDGPMRGADFETGGFINAQDIAQKAMEDRPLNHAELNALTRIP